MSRSLGLVTLVVREYDEAIQFFTEALRFTLIEDTHLDEHKRWVVVAPSGGGTSLLLARAATPEQRTAIGNQAGGRVAFFLYTDDFTGDYKHMREYGVHFEEEPRHEAYGSVVVFHDLYRNRWDLIEPSGIAP